VGRIGKSTDEIIEAATQLIDQNGLNNFQLGDVAKKMNMKSPSLYNHFDGLKDLIRAVQIKTNEMLFEKLQLDTQGLEGKDGFRKLCFAYRDFYQEHSGIYETMTIPIDKNDKELKRVTLKPVRLLTKFLSTLNMREEFSIHMVRFVRSSIHGFVDLEEQENLVIQVDAEQSFNILVDMLIDGIWRKSELKCNK
jgi:AcrR family transcriptional regulator